MRNIITGLFGARIQIGLTRDAMAIMVRGAGPRAQTTVLAELALADDIAHQPPNLSKLCSDALDNANYRQLPLHVILDDSLARLFLVTPPQNVSRMQDLQAAAAMRFHSLFGDAPSDWQIEADWQTTGAFLACALPKTLINELQQIATDHHLYLYAVQPYFVAAWNKHRQALHNDGWFGVIQGNNMTLGILGTLSGPIKREFQAVRTMAIPADGHALPWLREQLARVALQMNTASPEKLYLTGNQQQYWTASAGANGFVLHNLDNVKLTDTTKAALSPAKSMAQSALCL